MFKFKKVEVEKLAKFLVVGASGTLLGLGILYLLTDIVGWLYIHSYIVAFLTSTTSNYILNSFWTFKQDCRAIQWTKYVGISSATLMLNTSLMFALTTGLGLWYILSAVIVTAVIFIINFILSRRYVWNKSKEVYSQ